MRAHADLRGVALARAHAKAGDAARIAGNLGGTDRFDQAIDHHAVASADPVERDHATFVAAVRSGARQRPPPEPAGGCAGVARSRGAIAATAGGVVLVLARALVTRRPDGPERASG